VLSLGLLNQARNYYFTNYNSCWNYKARCLPQCGLFLICTFWAQAKQLNGGGELFRQKYPKLGVRLVDGSGLATAVVLKSIPHDTKQVFLHAGPSKIACAMAFALCERGVQVYVYAILHIFVALSCIYFVTVFHWKWHYTCLVDQVIMNPKKEYDMLKSQIADSKASYLKHSSNHTPQVNVLF
jgi:aldehyde decarbonylase